MGSGYDNNNDPQFEKRKEEDKIKEKEKKKKGTEGINVAHNTAGKVLKQQKKNGIKKHECPGHDMHDPINSLSQQKE